SASACKPGLGFVTSLRRSCCIHSTTAVVSWRKAGLENAPQRHLKHRWRWSRMLYVGPYVFKQAESPEEFAQIHALNYRTFVGEIPHDAAPGNGVLVDKFHGKNS